MRANLSYSQLLTNNLYVSKMTKRKYTCFGCRKLYPGLQHQIWVEYVLLFHILHVGHGHGHGTSSLVLSVKNTSLECPTFGKSTALGELFDVTLACEDNK